MLSYTLRDYMKTPLRFIKIIWLAFQAAAALYYVIARIMAQNWGPEDKLDLAYTPVFYAVAAALAVVSIYYNRWAFSDARIAASPAAMDRKGAVASPGLTETEQYTTLDENDRRLIDVFAYAQKSYIITWAMQETIAILGLVMTIVTQDVSQTVFFSLAAFLLLAFTRPRPLEIMERASMIPGRGR